MLKRQPEVGPVNQREDRACDPVRRNEAQRTIEPQRSAAERLRRGGHATCRLGSTADAAIARAGKKAYSLPELLRCSCAEAAIGDLNEWNEKVESNE